MKFSKTKLAVFLSVTLVLIAAVTITAFAYFSTRVYVYTNDGDKNVAHLGMNLSLLFDKLNSGTTDGAKISDGTELPFINPVNGSNYTFLSSADWGSAQNPYVISDIRHLQNLSALQDIGYFDEHFIQDNFQKADGNLVLDANGERIYTAGSNVKPYFLICKSTGEPVTINGTGVVIKPIGNEEFPFIGEIGGAFVEGTTMVNNLSSDTSTIFNITVQSKIAMPDHGLFGHISYLGQSPDEVAFKANAGSGKFLGYVSKVSDILMADVSLVVKNAGLWDTFVDWVGHIFSFTETGQEEDFTIPHETNHIGILAGHVTYTDVNNISVYYSDDNKVCIDLHDLATHKDDDTHTLKANYFSSTGIIGYIYSMNPQYVGNEIKIGTGSSTASVGSLGGGGSASGVNPGYVLAAQMFDLYSQYSKPAIMTDDDLPTYKSGNNNLGYKILVSVKLTPKTENGQTSMVPTIIYTDEIGRALTPSTNTYSYTDSAGNTTNLRHWTYTQLGVDANGNQTSTTVTLADGPYFFCQMELADKDSVNGFDKDSNGNNIFYPTYYTYNSLTNTIVEVKGTDDEETLIGYKVSTTGAPIAVVELNIVSNVSSDMFLYTAKDKDGNPVCAQWYRTRLLSGILGWIGLNTTEATGRYYFYDGVFTFALSGLQDAIREIWPAVVVEGEAISTVPNFTLAPEGGWQTGIVSNGEHTVTLTPVTGAVNTTDLYVLAFTGTDGELYFMNLNAAAAGEGYAGQFAQASETDIFEDRVLTAVEGSSGAYKVRLGSTVMDKRLLDNYLISYNGTNEINAANNPDNKLGIYIETFSTIRDQYIVSRQLYSGGEDYHEATGEEGIGQYVYRTYNYCYPLTIQVDNTGGATIQFEGTYDYYVVGGWNGRHPVWEKETGKSPRYMSYTATTNNYGISTNQFTLSETAPTNKPTLYKVTYGYEKPADGEVQLGMTVDPNFANSVVKGPFPANQYVLYPQSILGDGTNGITTHVSDDPIYGLIDVAMLGKVKDDDLFGTWKFEDGKLLGEYTSNGDFTGLKYMFDLQNGVKYGTVTANFLQGDWDGGDAFVKAKLGTDGAEAFIPMGCISFKVNKDPAPNDPIKIRVIVAVPTSGVASNADYNEDYYFALWKSSVDAGTTEQLEHAKNNAIYKFELPRSRPLYRGETLVDTHAKPVKIRVDSNDNGKIDGDEATTYETYLQGEMVLVAYEFTVTEAGVYTIGTTNEDSPMQIVYFSADGVASLGRDGTGGAQLQGIDFVYDNANGKIVTVTDVAPDTIVGENYDYYYPSYCVLYLDNHLRFNNEFVRIYHEEIYIRRQYLKDSQEDVKTQLSLNVKSGAELTKNDGYVKLESYEMISDVIKKTYYAK